MPYGLTNMPAVLQAFVNEISTDMLEHCALVYKDLTLSGMAVKWLVNVAII